MALKIIKWLGVNPMKEAQLTLQKLEHSAENGKTSHAHGFEHFIFVKVNNTRQCGRQIHCKFIKTSMAYFRNGKVDSKLHMHLPRTVIDKAFLKRKLEDSFPSMGGNINTRWSVHRMDCQSGMKRNDALTRATTWMVFDNNML